MSSVLSPAAERVQVPFDPAAPKPGDAFLSVPDAIETLRVFGNQTRAGDLDERASAALALLYTRYGTMIRVVVGRILGSAEAEDVLHDVFCRLPWIMPQFASGGFGGWLRQVATRTALMRLRRAARVDYVDEIPEPRNQTPTVTSADDRELLARGLAELPIPLREVVVLRFFLDLSHEEISEILEITRNASEVRLCRALKRLRMRLRELVAVPNVRSRAAD